MKVTRVACAMGAALLLSAYIVLEGAGDPAGRKGKTVKLPEPKTVGTMSLEQALFVTVEPRRVGADDGRWPRGCRTAIPDRGTASTRIFASAFRVRRAERENWGVELADAARVPAARSMDTQPARLCRRGVAADGRGAGGASADRAGDGIRRLQLRLRRLHRY